MMKYFFKAMAIIAVTGFFNTAVMAQEDKGKGKLDNNDEIIIRKKGDKDTKVTVEIKDGEVTVNGKPLSEFDDNDVVIRKRKSGPSVRAYGEPGSPFRGGTWNFDNNDMKGFNFNYSSNRALLGVVTEKTDDGVKVNSVTKGSAAEKAGLKENDIITKVDETAVNSPEDLTRAIGKFKPEDKAVIAYKRDKKDQKANVILGKRNSPDMMDGNNFRFDRDFDLDIRPRIEDNLAMLRGGNPRLGIKAQDTEEGKGVKVLGVEEASNAQKAGIKEGDIITEFEGKPVNSAVELAGAARDAKDKNTLKVKVNRNGKSQEMEIKIPKKLKTANL